MTEWEIKEHPDFTTKLPCNFLCHKNSKRIFYGFRDLNRLGVKDLELFYKKVQKVKENPTRLKHLGGGLPCYREPITKNIRLIYAIEGKTIWLPTIGPHDDSYENFRKRLYTLREKYGLP